MMDVPQEVPPPANPVDAITSAPEFLALCTHLERFVHQGDGAPDVRTAICVFAGAAKACRWSSELILKALHETPCYPRSVGGITNRMASKRYSQALDFLLDDYFNG